MARQIAAIIGLALVAGTLSNLTAGPTRVLAWVGTYTALPSPPPGDAAQAPAKPPEGSAAKDVATTAAPASEPPAHPYEIDTAAAIAEHAKGTIFLDARATDVFAMGRIPGARSIPVWEAAVDQKVMELMMQAPPPATRFVIYCQGGHCEDSHMLRQKLLGAGYTDVLVYKDGFPGWQGAGKEVEK